MEKLFVLVVALALMVSGLRATTAAPARPYEGKTFYVYLGVSPVAREDHVSFVGPKLKEKWGIDLSFEILGAAQMLEKMIPQRENPRVSVAGWDAFVAIQACEIGLCAPLDASKVPNLSDVPAFALHKTDGAVKAVDTNTIAVGLLYNRYEFQRRGLKPPVSWYDLWRDDLKGRVSITAPESGVGLAVLAMFARLEGGADTNVDPAFRKLKTLLPNVHTIHTWSSELANLMQLGEVWVGTTISNMGPALQSQGFPAEWVAPKEGAVVSDGAISIIANAPYQDVAQDYVNLILSPEYQALRARHGGLQPINKKGWAILSELERSRFPVKPLTKVITVDWGAIMKARQGWIERWHREIRQ